jgi:solute carrier family 15 oligopeptide transporter 1
MDGNTWGWVIKPDQLQVINPLMVLAFIPLFDRGIYPLLAKFGLLKKPLQRLTMGGIFAGIAFVVSGMVELSLEVMGSIDFKGISNVLINIL